MAVTKGQAMKLKWDCFFVENGTHYGLVLICSWLEADGFEMSRAIYPSWQKE